MASSIAFVHFSAGAPVGSQAAEDGVGGRQVDVIEGVGCLNSAQLGISPGMLWYNQPGRGELGTPSGFVHTGPVKKEGCTRGAGTRPCASVLRCCSGSPQAIPPGVSTASTRAALEYQLKLSEPARHGP